MEKEKEETERNRKRQKERDRHGDKKKTIKLILLDSLLQEMAQLSAKKNEERERKAVDLLSTYNPHQCI